MDWDKKKTTLIKDMKSIIGSCRKLNSGLVNLNGTLFLTIYLLFGVISA